MTSSVHGPRSALSVPGDRGDRFDGALRSDADMVILDLEDAVSPRAKVGARQQVTNLLADGRVTLQDVVVRVNAPSTSWFEDDVRAVSASPFPCGILIPKVEDAAVVAHVAELAGGSGSLEIWALVESARGLARVLEIAAAAPLVGLVIGYADLAASLGRSLADPAWWLGVQDAVLVAARSHDLIALDGPSLTTVDDEAFRSGAERARALGFDGRWVIHPRQVDTVNQVFSPSPEDVSHALRVLEALDAAGTTGSGVAVLDGQMLDEAVAVAARRTVAKAGPRSE